MITYPFTFDPKVPFISQASDWIADVFYERLPEAGFEIRDEQIYMAFQLERAYQEKRTIFAEAGVGTGKTLVYLLYAILYARYTRKPAIIACADESLIEQLVKPEGDVAKLARHLELNIDARLGKSQDQYLCLNKLDGARFEHEPDAERFRAIYRSLPEFVRSPETLQSFYPYGNRKDYPELTDQQWGKIGWDVFQDCLACSQRHRCGQTLSREHFRKSTDLIICSHDFYMEHVWTYEARKREGQLPLLPEHSSVVFDEGHLLETAAQSALTYQFKHHLFENILVRLLAGEVRETLAYAIEEAISQSEALFALLERNSIEVPGSNRKDILGDEMLMKEVQLLQEALDQVEEELVFESAMFTLNEYQLKIVEEHLETIQRVLSLFRTSDTSIAWVDEDKDGLTLVVMPKQVKEILAEHVFSDRMPVVFSSATLSVEGSFEYIADSLGVHNYLSFSVPSPYAYEEKMRVISCNASTVSEKMRLTLERLQKSEGRTLLLFPSFETLRQFKQDLLLFPESHAFTFMFEGDAEISHLISKFQNDEHSNLCAVTLWEGLDIPGPALSQVIMWDLPFPPNDPVFSAKRKESGHPFEEVDLPYMLLRLRQGVGRLIRSQTDQGTIVIFGQALKDDKVMEHVERVLPVLMKG